MFRESTTNRNRLTTLGFTCLLLIAAVLPPAAAQNLDIMPQYILGPVFGGIGSTPGKFYAVSDVAVGPDGSVYACDYENHRVQQFSAESKFIRTWGSCGRGPGQFSGPAGIATDTKGNVYVVETSNPRVQKFTPNGKFVTKWSVPASGESEVFDLTDIAIDPSNNVYVVSQICHRVWKFTPWGSLAASWTSGPILNDQSDYGAGSLSVDTDLSGNVYVMNIEHERVEKYSPPGQLLKTWKTPLGGIALDAEGRLYVADEKCVRVYSQGGSEIGRLAEGFEAASGMTFAPDGSLYVAEARESRVRHMIRVSQPNVPAVVPTPTQTSNATPHENGRIAFVRTSHGNDDVYVIQPDGSGLKRLTMDPAVDWHPSWSPDGTRIVFSSRRDGRSSIYAMADDGSGVTRLTSGLGNDYEPAWSPDGEGIVFRRAIGDTEEADNDLWLVNPDGSEPRQLTSGHWCDLSPAWSHDGKRIIFARRYDGSATHSSLKVINADGSGLRDVVVPGGDSCEEPAFSPDGGMLAYVSMGSQFSIMLRSLRGSRCEQIRGSDNMRDPAWSPDGRYLVCHKGYDEATLSIIDVAAQTAKVLAEGTEASWGRTAASPPMRTRSEAADGSFEVFAVTRDQRVRRFAVGLLSLTPLPDGQSPGNCWLAVSPDGKHRCWTSRTGGPGRAIVTGPDGVTPFEGQGQSWSKPTASGLDHFVCALNRCDAYGNTGVYQIGLKQPMQKLAQPPADFLVSTSWLSPDGGYVASEIGRHMSTIILQRCGSTHAAVRLCYGAGVTASWMPDGTGLVVGSSTDLGDARMGTPGLWVYKTDGIDSQLGHWDEISRRPLPPPTMLNGCQVLTVQCLTNDRCIVLALKDQDGASVILDCRISDRSSTEIAAGGPKKLAEIWCDADGHIIVAREPLNDGVSSLWVWRRTLGWQKLQEDVVGFACSQAPR